MLKFPEIDPTIFSLGRFQLRWYSLMYIIGWTVVYMYLRKLSRQRIIKASLEQVEGIIMSGIIGMLLGARITYVFIYNWDYYKNNLAEILQVWHGGLSFHGAMIGISLAILYYCRKHKLPFYNVMDHGARMTTVGLFFGRLGNFINAELWGRTSDVPWAMVFPGAGPEPRHPSQLYEAFFEGIVLFLVLTFIGSRKPKQGVVGSCFLLGYGTFRFFVEFFREPDAQLGTVLGPFSMGQLLCAMMWIAGGIFLSYSLSRNDNEPRYGVPYS